MTQQTTTQQCTSDAPHCYDVVILGAGTAGQSAYNQVVKSTANVLVVNAGPWDTTCARVGCMPSKLLIEASKYAHASQHASEFGISNQTHIDPKAVVQRVQHLRDYFTGHAQAVVDQWPAQHKKQGKAQFIDATTLQVGDDIIRTKTTIIATGSTPRIPSDWQQALKHKLLTSDTIFNLPELPKSIIVVGAGAIGIELAQALARLGVEVTVINQGETVGGLSNPDLRQLATKLIGTGLNLVHQSTVEQVYLQDNDVVLHYHSTSTSIEQHSEQIKADYLLAAIGRESSINDLGLEKINSKYQDIKKPIHDLHTMQLDDLPIFIAGDVLTPHALQHEAANDGRIAGKNAARYPQVESFEPYAGLSIVFSAPQMATAGQSHKALSSANIPFIHAEVSYQHQGRATIQDKNHGAIQLYGCPTTQRLLGAELLVNDAEHLAHLLAWAIQQNLTVPQLLAMPFYHPVLEEGLRTALVRLRAQLA
ncbi:MAG: dihydrolipoyl dehydrogenase [Moraxellaceae bacterium]|nr:MAG: dihydrolipoyl dehydrogenase [Moraxellaceae bacterium]